MARKALILIHAVQLKPTIKVQISGRMASIGISEVVTASVYSEKARMKKLMMMKMIIIIIIIIMNKSHFRYEIKSRKVIVDFKFDTLYS